MRLTVEIRLDGDLWEMWERDSPDRKSLANLCVQFARSVFRACGQDAKDTTSHDRGQAASKRVPTEIG